MHESMLSEPQLQCSTLLGDWRIATYARAISVTMLELATVGRMSTCIANKFDLDAMEDATFVS